MNFYARKRAVVDLTLAKSHYGTFMSTQIVGSALDAVPSKWGALPIVFSVVEALIELVHDKCYAVPWGLGNKFLTLH